MNIISSIKHAVTGERHAPVKAAGTVTDVFGHRIVVQTATGKVLADIGPKAAETIKVKQHDHVEIEGDQKPAEIKVRRIGIAGGQMYDTGHGGPKHDKQHRHGDAPFGPAEATAMARTAGYDLIGDARPNKRHFEAVATKGGTKFEIHVHRDGRVEPKRDLGVDA
jgi:hypothetical protein